ncbi:hypothetical protein C8Q78DRAFT_1082157 [Trametes maxima]|nr:hypothetical protein C8Q78DRAFT_1082157 [Trametes maxima]
MTDVGSSQQYYAEESNVFGATYKGYNGDLVRRVAPDECPGIFTSGPDDLFRGVRPELVLEYEKLPPRTKLVIQPLGQKRLDEHARDHIAKLLTRALLAILGPNEAKLMAPLSDGETHLDTDFPTGWSVFRLTENQWSTLATYPVFATKDIAFSTHAEPLKPSRYLVSFTGFEEDSDEAIRRTIKNAFLSMAHLPNLVKAIKGGKPGSDTIRLATDIIEGFDIAVNRDDVNAQPRGAKIWASVYCDLPCGAREWVTLREQIQTMRMPHMIHCNARVAPPMRCEICHSAEHIAQICHFPKMAEMLAPMYLHIPFPPTHTPKFPGQSYEARFKPTNTGRMGAARNYNHPPDANVSYGRGRNERAPRERYQPATNPRPETWKPDPRPLRPRSAANWEAGPSSQAGGGGYRQ